MSSEIPEIPQSVSSSEESEVSSIDWIELFSVLWSSRKLIAMVTGIATVGAVIVSLLLPEYYKSTATLLPETEKSKLAALGGLGDLAALAGMSVGGEGSLAKLYPTIIKSESVLRNVIYAKYQTQKFKEPVNLIAFWEIKENTPELEFEVALKTLRDDLEISVDNKTAIVTLATETREAQLSADILNTISKELDGFIRTKRITNASEQRRWIEGRLVDLREDLQISENKLKEFREKNRRVGDSPHLLLEQGRLVREVEINSTIYMELKKQYELVKIEEIKNIPVISVMDIARPAARKSKPRVSTIVLSSSMISFLVGIVVVFAQHRYKEFIVGLTRSFREKEIRASAATEEK